MLQGAQLKLTSLTESNFRAFSSIQETERAKSNKIRDDGDYATTMSEDYDSRVPVLQLTHDHSTR